MRIKTCNIELTNCETNLKRQSRPEFIKKQNKLWGQKILLKVNASARTILVTICSEGYFKVYFLFGDYFEDYFQFGNYFLNK